MSLMYKPVECVGKTISRIVYGDDEDGLCRDVSLMFSDGCTMQIGATHDGMLAASMRNGTDDREATDTPANPLEPTAASVHPLVTLPEQRDEPDEADPNVLDVIFGPDGWYAIVAMPDGPKGGKYILRFSEFSEAVRRDLEAHTENNTHDCKTLQALELAWAEGKHVRVEDVYRLIGMEPKAIR